MKLETRNSKLETRRAFSLVEVLLAIFILGIGLIMVATVFPVGATWTRQATEESVGQTIAQNALTVIKKHYGEGGNLRTLGYFNTDFFTVVDNITPPVINATHPNTVLRATGTIPVGAGIPLTPFVLQALPGFDQIPLSERTYLFGSNNPFPVVPDTKLASCTYSWNALIRLNRVHQAPLGSFNANGITPSTTYTYDLYILVFRKGAVEQTFNNTGTSVPAGSVEIQNTRFPGALDPLLLPSLVYAPYVAGSGSPVTGAYPAMGADGIGAFSGTVFHQIVDPGTYNNATPRPYLLGQPANALPQEPIILAPAADGTTVSPLIKIYQTTVSF